jgi:hypothetical protein
MNKLPFETQNRALSIALHFGGCRILAIWRIYSTEELRKLGMTEKEAAKRDLGGKVHILHEDGPQRAALEAAFDSVTDCDSLDLPQVSDEDSVRLVHLVLQFRKGIEKWLRNPACAHVMDMEAESHVTHHEDGSKTISLGTVTMDIASATPAMIFRK